MKPVIKRILCPIDFSEDSFIALRAAYALALCFSAHLIALHIMPGLHQLRLPGRRPVHHRIVESYFADRLDLAVKQCTDGDSRVESMVLEGSAPDTIIRMAERLKVDAIVLAEDKQNEWERVRDGSIAEEVIDHAHCPVLLLRDLEI
jgi:universal stress protein A